ncbi:MAG TPA: hypothetical protein DER67_01325 [Novosphingobium sp.]|nr:hypothetical protein [Novosphingobium sp.]
MKQGDLAKLIFRISIDNAEEPEAVERMWVLVREVTSSGFFGILDNDPSSVAYNDEFWSGIEVPFEARHVINFDERDENTILLAGRDPSRRWPRD